MIIACHHSKFLHLNIFSRIASTIQDTTEIKHSSIAANMYIILGLMFGETPVPSIIDKRMFTSIIAELYRMILAPKINNGYV